ncbi:MAG: bifunctional 23S rRNA (guanine(2069)-N(7))-methyltransferase RlmK/23S rRNA (guanine(2445)-N(2))-methyltransferase RlmL [Planctomycetia bacterium]|nr:bifunctional 23S rRNA (guanine(2069)-N(7))-methyltransferase RlmK/23S rRNA (guanine(2445)-N(2))-methyltransferase RlmL [Planctomycetia bacterium]
MEKKESGEISFIATSTMGLESIVSRELVDLGFEPRNVEVGRTIFEGSEKDLCRANIHLRCAGRVLIRVGEFPATDFGELFDKTADLPWERWIPRDGAFPVDGRSHKSQLSSVPACQRIVKKAIVSRLERVYGCSLVENGATYPVEVSMLKDNALLTLDTTGEGLHKRGYRKLIGSAPLRETIAAALIKLSYWNRERPLLDPFCGSGTIPIEAALIGRNIAPGIRRSFLAETWETLPNALWREVREEARDLILPNSPRSIVGADIDPEAVSMAKYHAQCAGVGMDIQFIERDFHQTTSAEEFGCTIMNPPYGNWIGEYDELRDLYFALPGVLQRLPTWSHYIYTGFPDFEKHIGQEAHRRRKIYNSRLECTYYQFFGPRPPRTNESDIREELEPAERQDDPNSEEVERPTIRAFTPVFQGLSDSVERSAADFENRLRKLAHHLRRYPTRRGITCYRIYDRDIPEIPLAIDRYEDHLHISEYQRPHDRTSAQQTQWLDLMLTTICRALDTPREKTFLKERRRQKGTSQYNRLSQRGYVIEAHEGGLKFLVNLSDFLDTGLFLDHRITRDRVRKEARGKRVLNLFAYTGSFSVYAADGGAQSITTVDLSNGYLDWAYDNMRLNGFEDRNFKYIRSDVGKFLFTLYEREFFDLVICDPPTFSNSKDLNDWDVQRDHVALIDALSRHMPSGGVLYFSNNHRKFKLRESEIEGFRIRDISNQTVPEDFRNKKIHQCWRMTKK